MPTFSKAITLMDDKKPLTVEEIDKEIESLKVAVTMYQEKLHQSIGSVNVLEYLKKSFSFVDKEREIAP